MAQPAPTNSDVHHERLVHPKLIRGFALRHQVHEGTASRRLRSPSRREAVTSPLVYGCVCTDGGGGQAGHPARHQQPPTIATSDRTKVEGLADVLTG